MNIVGNFLLALAVITNLVLAFMLYLKGKNRITNVSFAIVVFFLALWTLTIFLYETSGDLGNIILYTKLANVSAILILPFFLHFSFVFPFSNKKGSRYLIISVIAAIPIIAIIYFLLFTNLHVKEISIGLDGSRNIIYGPAYYLYTAYFVLLLLWTFSNIILKHRRANGINKIQIKYVLFATILVAVFGSILNLVLPRFGVSRFSWLGPQFTLIMAGIISYAIVKHRLLDIVVIIRRATIFGILIAIILGIFSAIAFGLPAIFAETLPQETYQITLVAVAFIVALFFQPLRRAIEEFTDKWFFKGTYKPQVVIDELSEKISSIIDLRVLLDSTAQILLNAFRSEHAVFSVREKLGRGDNYPHLNPLPEGEGMKEDVRFIAYNTEGRHRPMEEYAYDGKHPFTKYFNKYLSDVIIRDELQREVGDLGSMKHESRNMKHRVKRSGDSVDIRLKQTVLKEMESHDFAILFPVLSKEELVGIFGLGAKKSGDIYSAQDLNVLELFAHQVGVSVENTKLYADLKLFNEKLQLEVEKATQDLRVTNAQLTFRNKDLGALQKITNLITRTLDLAEITQTIADSIHTELGYIGGIIYFYDREKKILKASAITRTPLTQGAIKLLPKSPFEYVINDSDNNLNAEAVKSGSMKMSNKFSDFVHPPLPKILIDEMQKLLGMRTVVAVPIFVENEAIGLINFGLNKNQGEITDQELQMMRSLADQMGIVVRNARLYEAVKSYSGKLEEANEYLKELDQTKSEFISIASHQLRSPMTGIKGYLSMLIDGDFGVLDEKKKGIMRQMFENTERLIRLINIFLNVSRIEAGRLHLDKRETHIDEVIKSVISEMSNQAKSKKLDLYFEEPKEKIPPFTADFDKLRDVVLNFVDNAIKYTASGKVWVEVSLTTRPKQLSDNNNNNDKGLKIQDSGIMVRVNDTGMGLDPEDAKKLFDKFSRVKGIAQINPDGSGLGLYIAKKLSEAHGGGVWVESKGKGKGSSFCLWVPASPKL